MDGVGWRMASINCSGLHRGVSNGFSSFVLRGTSLKNRCRVKAPDSRRATAVLSCVELFCRRQVRQQLKAWKIDPADPKNTRKLRGRPRLGGHGLRRPFKNKGTQSSFSFVGGRGRGPGVYLAGLFLEGASWSRRKGILEERVPSKNCSVEAALMKRS